jgi:hypothetical protein
MCLQTHDRGISSLEKIKRNLIIFTLLQALLNWSIQGGEDCHVARMGDVRNTYYNIVAKPKGRDNFGDLRVHGTIILKCIWNV